MLNLWWVILLHSKGSFLGMNHNGNLKKRTLCVLVTCIVFLGLIAPPSSRADSVSAEEVYDLILEVKRDRKTLSNAIIGMEKDEKFFLPVLDIARLVGVSAKPDFDAQTVTGFFLSEDNVYSLNIKDSYYSLNGEKHSFPEGEAFILKQKYGIAEVYISPELMNKMWPLDLNLDHLFQLVEIRTKKSLPYESRKSREEKRRNSLFRLGASGGDDSSTGVLKIKNKPKMVSLPALDLSTSLNYFSKQRRQDQSFSLFGRNDLAKGEVNYNLRAVRRTDGESGIEDARFLYTKRAYNDEDLPFDLQLFQAGDVSSKLPRLITGSVRGRGAIITNAPQKRTVDFDQLLVEGLAEPGWEVEVYRNNELIGFQIVDEQGQYSFDNVQLNYSQTTIKTILYGPQGEVETRIQKYNIASDMLKPGQTTYELGLLDSDRDLIPFEEDVVTQGTGFAKNLNVSHGINKYITGFGSLSDIPIETGGQQFATLGLKFSLYNAIGSIETYRSSDGGSAYDVKVARDFLGANLNFRAAVLSDFESPQVGFGDSAEVFRVDASASRSFRLPVGNLGLSLRYEYELSKNDRALSTYDFRQSFSYQGLRLNHGLKSTFSEKSHLRTDGSVSAAYRLNSNWDMRGVASYEIFPDLSTQSISSELRYRDRDRFTAAVSLEQSIQNRRTKFGGQVGYDFDKLRTSFDLSWDRDNGVVGLFRTSFAVAPFGPNNKYKISNTNMSNRSALNARVFLDKDYNGVFSAADEVMEGVRLNVGSGETPVSSENGIISYITPARTEYEEIGIDSDSLDDPYMLPNVAPFTTVMRPATALSYDFPIIETGIIEGTVTDSTGPIISAQIQLLAANGQILDTTTTAFDGYYSFEYIRPGSYIVQIDPANTQVSIPPRSVSVTSEDLFQFNIDLHLLEQAAEAACVTFATDDGRVTQNCQSESSTQSGMDHPALVPLSKGTASVRVSQVRVGEYSDKLRIVLDLSAPTAIRVWEQSDRKQVTIDLPDTFWETMQQWQSANPHIIKDFSVAPLGQNGVSITLNAIQKIEVSEKAMLTPNSKDFYRFYVDFRKCTNGCK